MIQELLLISLNRVSVCLRGLAAGTISQILALLSNGTSLGALATSVGLLYFHAAAEDMAADAVVRIV